MIILQAVDGGVGRGHRSGDVRGQDRSWQWESRLLGVWIGSDMIVWAYSVSPFSADT